MAVRTPYTLVAMFAWGDVDAPIQAFQKFARFAITSARRHHVELAAHTDQRGHDGRDRAHPRARVYGFLANDPFRRARDVVDRRAAHVKIGALVLVAESIGAGAPALSFRPRRFGDRPAFE